METGNKLEFNDLPSDIRLKFDYLDTLVLNSYNGSAMGAIPTPINTEVELGHPDIDITDSQVVEWAYLSSSLVSYSPDITAVEMEGGINKFEITVTFTTSRRSVYSKH